MTFEEYKIAWQSKNHYERVEFKSGSFHDDGNHIFKTKNNKYHGAISVFVGREKHFMYFRFKDNQYGEQIFIVKL